MRGSSSRAPATTSRIGPSSTRSIGSSIRPCRIEDPRALLLPTRLEGPWKPVLSLEFPGHRSRLTAGAIRFLKTRLVLPAVRWLYEVQPREFPPPAPGEPCADGDRADAGRRSRPPEGAPRRPGAPTRSMKLLCVVQRYGPEVTGGSEALCRAIAQRLAARHDVSVATSCATDYVTWANALPAGTSKDGAVTVHRFPSSRERPLHEFWRLSDRALRRRRDRGRAATLVPPERTGAARPAHLPARARPRLRSRAVLHLPIRALVVRPAARRRSRRARADRRARRADPLEHDPGAVLPPAARLPVPDAGRGNDDRPTSARATLPPSAVIGSGIDPVAARQDRARARRPRHPGGLPALRRPRRSQQGLRRARASLRGLRRGGRRRGAAADPRRSAEPGPPGASRAPRPRTCRTTRSATRS